MRAKWSQMVDQLPVVKGIVGAMGKPDTPLDELVQSTSSMHESKIDIPKTWTDLVAKREAKLRSKTHRCRCELGLTGDGEVSTKDVWVDFWQHYVRDLSCARSRWGGKRCVLCRSGTSFSFVVDVGVA